VPSAIVPVNDGRTLLIAPKIPITFVYPPPIVDCTESQDIVFLEPPLITELSLVFLLFEPPPIVE